MKFWIYGYRVMFEMFVIYAFLFASRMAFRVDASYLTDCLLFWRENTTRVVLFERFSGLLDPV